VLFFISINDNSLIFEKALLGDRYGQSFLPFEIDRNEFEVLKKEMRPEELDFSFDDELKINTNDIVGYCYKLDENKKDRLEYKLLDILSISKHEVCFVYFILYTDDSEQSLLSYLVILYF
jgi:hypothetical protein